MPRFEIETPEGRRRAVHDLMWTDHGFLRVWFRNLRQIDDRMWRSNQPSPDHVAKAAAMGIRTIVNLRGQNDSGHYWLEKEACEAHGIVLVEFAVKSRDVPSVDHVMGAKRIFETIAYPALMHCKSGADRAGLMGTLYRILAKDEPVSAAIEQLSLKYLHVRQGKTGLIDHFFETFLAWARANGKPDDKATFVDWVQNVYDPVATKADFMSTWWGTMLTEKVLKRE
jgi:protein tyrosine/serine phosphatase